MATLPTFRNGRIALPLGIVLLALLFLFLAVAASQQRNAQWREQLFNEARRDLSVLEQARQAMRGEARIAVYSLSQDPDVLRLIRRINTLIREHGRAIRRCCACAPSWQKTSTVSGSYCARPELKNYRST